MTKTIKFSDSALTHIGNVARAGMANEVATLHALPVLQRECAGMTRDDVKAAVMPHFAYVCGITLTVKKTGAIVWPSDDARTDAAKRACNRFIERIVGKTTKETQDVEVPAELLAAARKLAKLAQQYEGARGLASKALAQAFAE